MTRMDCGEVRDLLQAYEDDELSLTEQASVETHLRTCPECSNALAELRRLRERVKAAGTYSPPIDFVARVLARIDTVHDGAARTDGWRRLTALAASHAAVGLLAAAITIWALTRTDTQQSITRDVVAAHVRAMLAQQLVQVASADIHTVRPWFAGRVAFAPVVVDLAAHGFPLAGGRVDLLFDQMAASLVYGRRKHQISVLILPDELARGAGEFRAARNGYNIVAWRQSGFTHFAVSDLNAVELEILVEKLRASQAL